MRKTSKKIKKIIQWKNIKIKFTSTVALITSISFHAIDFEHKCIKTCVYEKYVNKVIDLNKKIYY